VVTAAGGQQPAIGIQRLSRLARSLLSEPPVARNSASQSYQARYDYAPSWQGDYTKNNEDGFNRHAQARNPHTQMLKAWIAQRSESGRSPVSETQDPEATTQAPTPKSIAARTPSGEGTKTPYELAAQPRPTPRSGAGAGPLQMRERNLQTKLLNAWLSQLPQGNAAGSARAGQEPGAARSNTSRAPLGSSAGRERHGSI
jgi:hypothetical protein